MTLLDEETRAARCHFRRWEKHRISRAAWFC